jgi:hypothetical protein
MLMRLRITAGIVSDFFLILTPRLIIAPHFNGRNIVIVVIVVVFTFLGAQRVPHLRGFDNAHHWVHFECFPFFIEFKIGRRHNMIK